MELDTATNDTNSALSSRDTAEAAELDNSHDATDDREAAACSSTAVDTDTATNDADSALSAGPNYAGEGIASHSLIEKAKLILLFPA